MYQYKLFNHFCGVLKYFCTFEPTTTPFTEQMILTSVDHKNDWKRYWEEMKILEPQL